MMLHAPVIALLLVTAPSPAPDHAQRVFERWLNADHLRDRAVHVIPMHERERRVTRFENRAGPDKPVEEPSFDGVVTTTPEPISLSLIATGLIGLGAIRHRRNSRLGRG